MAKGRARELEDDDADGPPPVIGGKAIDASKLKLVGMFAACVGFFVLCGYMLFERWVLPEDGGVLPFRLTWWGSALCGVGFLIGVGGMIAFPFELLCPKRLILGADAFQVVRRWTSGDVVEVHIPYANVEEVAYEKHDDEWRLGVDLRDVKDPGTYAKDRADLRKQQSQGRDFILDGGYTMSLEEIARLLKKRVRKAARPGVEEIPDE